MGGEKRKVAVIGAGHVGLLFMRNILQAGHEVVGFEMRSQVGGMWNFESKDPESGYDKCNPDGSVDCGFSALKLNTSKVNILGSDDLLGQHQTEACQWMNTDQFLSSLHKTAQTYNLLPLIQFNTQVTNLEKLGKLGWSISYTSRGESKKEKSTDWLLCTGGFRFPKWPSYPNMDKFKGVSVHSAQIRLEEPLFANRVVIVIGGSFSGTDIAYYALKNKAKKVFWMYTRGLHNRNYWVIDRCPADTPENRPFDLNFNRYAWFDKPDVGQDFLTSITAFVGTSPQNQNKVTLPGDKLGVTEIPYILKQIEDKNLVIIDPVSNITDTGVELKDGTSIDGDVLVYCTGFETRFPVLDGIMPMDEQKGNEFYYNLLPVDEKLHGVAIAGAYEAITAVTCIHELQARWLNEYWLTRDYNDQGLLFSAEETASMKKAVEKRRNTKITDAKFNYVTDIWGLSDTLARDVGCLPPDYRELICSKNADQNTRRNDVQLGIALMRGPMVTLQYRLQGKGSRKEAAEYFINVTKQQIGEQEFERCVKEALDQPEAFLKKAGINSSDRYCVKPYFDSILL